MLIFSSMYMGMRGICVCVCVFTSDIINYLQSTLKALDFAFQERYPRFLAITAFIISVQQRAPAYRR